MNTVEEMRFGVVRLASLTTSAIRSGTEAFIDGDLEAAARTVADDDGIDALRHSIEDECLCLLANPLEAGEIRLVGMTLRVIHELERSADLMVNVARTTSRLHPHALDPSSRSIVQRLGEQVTVQIRVAVNAFVDLDPSGAAALADMDDTVDELHKALLRHLLGGRGIPNDEGRIPRAVQLTLVGHHYERIGDHAVNIAEQVYRVVKGHRRARYSVPVSATG